MELNTQLMDVNYVPCVYCNCCLTCRPRIERRQSFQRKSISGKLDRCLLSVAKMLSISN